MTCSEISGVAEKLVQAILKRGFEEASAQVYRTKSVMVKFANSEVSVVQRWDMFTVGLYMTKEGKILLSEVHPTTFEQVDRLVDRAISASAQLKPSMLYAPLPEPAEIEKLEGLVDSNVLKTMEDPGPLAESLLSETSKADRVAGALTLTYTEKGLANSRGAKLEEAYTGVEAYLRVFVGESSGQWSYGSRRLAFDKARQMARTALELAERAEGEPKQIEPGAYDVLLSPMVVGNLVNLVGMMSSALAVLMGNSIFARVEPGSKVASENFSLFDSPRNPDLLGSTSFDDEAQETRNKAIIENGVLKTLLHNSKTAAKFGAQSTGNAGVMFPHAWTLSVNAGDASFDELIEEMKRGVVITNNWYTRLQNYVEGIFSTIARDAAFYVENGEVKYPVTRVRIADRLPKLLSNIELLGKEVYDISWWEVNPAVRAPYILARNIGISRPFV
ncbi:MAG: TldD/PmbA family protein [Thermofilaceae archaeon]|nr:TldD/PmbA family protein [Thermofilaceae archaeon]